MVRFLLVVVDCVVVVVAFDVFFFVLPSNGCVVFWFVVCFVFVFVFCVCWFVVWLLFVCVLFLLLCVCVFVCLLCGVSVVL